MLMRRCENEQKLKIFKIIFDFYGKTTIISTSKLLNSFSPAVETGDVVGVAQLVEHQIVVLGVAGSNPVAHPI